MRHRFPPPSFPVRHAVANQLSLALLASILTTVAGCTTHSACQVRGQVTLDGTPLTDGLVMFLPDRSDTTLRTVSAIITNGTFTAELPPGKYRVAFTSDQPSGKKIEADPGTGVMIDEYIQVIPRRYNADTQLEVEIAEDRDDLEFALTRK